VSRRSYNADALAAALARCDEIDAAHRIEDPIALARLEEHRAKLAALRRDDEFIERLRRRRAARRAQTTHTSSNGGSSSAQ
jgi:hypothetical protein